MKLRYILGRSGSGKTSFIFDEIKVRLTENSNKTYFLLVPEQFTLQTEYDFITKSNLSGIMNLQVISFNSLSNLVLNKVGGIRRTTISELGKIMILKRLFDINYSNLNVFKKASKQSGFLEDFSKLISEFKRSDISPEILKNKLQYMNEENVFAKKFNEISFMYDEYNSFMSENYNDNEDKFNLFIEKLDYANFLNNSEIWVDGFNGFTSQQYRTLEKLMLKVNSLNISLTFENKNSRDKDLFIPSINTYEKLRKIAEENNIKIEEIYLESKKSNKELRHLEEEIYSYPYKVYGDDLKDIFIFSSQNSYSEVERLAQEIVNLVREKNYRYKDIIVVAGDIDIYGSIVKKVFNEYDIPFFLDQKRNILSNLIIKFILSTLNMLVRNFKYEDVFKHIKTGFTNLTVEEAEILENYCLKYGIKGNAWFEEFMAKDDDLFDINKIRLKFIEPLERLRRKIKNKMKVIDFLNVLFEFLKDMNLLEKLDKLIDEFKRRKDFEYVNENSQIWNIVIEVFDQFAEILGDTSMSLKEFTSVLQTGFSEYKIGIIPPTIDQVLVGDIERSKSHNIKALFVIGVNDGILPRGYEDRGIVLDDEKLLLKDLGLNIMTDSESNSYEERFLIYKMFAKPSDFLWISYSLSDNEGKSLRPSYLIDRFKLLFPKINIKSDLVINNDLMLNLISRPKSTFKYLIEFIRNHVEGNDIDDIWFDIYNWYFNNYEWKEKLIKSIEGIFHNNMINYVDEGLAKKLYDKPFKSSISRLETFINCPFSHFIRYGLRPEERKEYKIKSPDLGRLLHKAIDSYVKKVQINKIAWNDIEKDESDKLVEEIIDDIVPEFQNNVLYSSYRYMYLVKKLKRVSKRATWTIIEHLRKGEFTPLFHEFGFGEGLNFDAPAIEIELPNNEKILLEGRIDRIDILDTDNGKFIKIIDYKSGNKKFSLSDVYYGLQIQLIVYIDTFINSKNFIKDELYPGGVFYFKIDDPLIKSEEIDESKIEEELMKKLKLDGLIVKDIKVIKALDKDIEINKKSNIIPVSMNKDKSISKNSSVIEKEELDQLIIHVKNIIKEIGIEILKGNVKIEPCKTKQHTACDFCEFKSICQFDTSIRNNKHRILLDLKDEDVITKIKNESGDIDAKLD